MTQAYIDYGAKGNSGLEVKYKLKNRTPVTPEVARTKLKDTKGALPFTSTVSQ